MLRSGSEARLNVKVKLKHMPAVLQVRTLPGAHYAPVAEWVDAP